jgi:hypothetical protein
MSRRDRQAHHVGEGSRVMISDLPDQSGDLAGEHRLTGNDLVERGQGPFMISGGCPFHNEPVPQAAGKPYAHPGAGHRGVILISRHRIVERPVKVTKRNVDSHPGDRKLGLAGFGHTR